MASAGLRSRKTGRSWAPGTSYATHATSIAIRPAHPDRLAVADLAEDDVVAVAQRRSSPAGRHALVTGHPDTIRHQAAPGKRGTCLHSGGTPARYPSVGGVARDWSGVVECGRIGVA